MLLIDFDKLTERNKRRCQQIVDEIVGIAKQEEFEEKVSDIMDDLRTKFQLVLNSLKIKDFKPHSQQEEEEEEEDELF